MGAVGRSESSSGFSYHDERVDWMIIDQPNKSRLRPDFFLIGILKLTWRNLQINVRVSKFHLVDSMILMQRPSIHLSQLHRSFVKMSWKRVFRQQNVISRVVTMCVSAHMILVITFLTNNIIARFHFFNHWLGWGLRGWLCSSPSCYWEGCNKSRSSQGGETWENRDCGYCSEEKDEALKWQQCSNVRSPWIRSRTVAADLPPHTLRQILYIQPAIWWLLQG